MRSPSFVSPAFIIFFVLTFSGAANASFEFSPIVATLTPSGSGATTSFQAFNGSNNKIPIQVSIFVRDPDLKGNEVYKESDDIDEQFKVFPSQLVLDPHETRTIRVQWIGSKKLTSELSFRIVAEEMPVDLDDPDRKVTKSVAKINILTHYVGSLYVSPPGVAPKVTVDAKPLAGAKDKLVLTFKNEGTAHRVLKSPVLKFQPAKGGSPIELSGQVLKEIEGQNVLAQKTRQFELPWPKNLPAVPMKIDLELAKE